LPPRGVDGPGPSAARSIISALRAGQALSGRLRRVDDRTPLRIGCLSSIDGSIFVLGNSILRIHQDWSAESLGPVLRHAGGLAATDHGAYFFRDQKLGWQGLAQLQFGDFERGRVSKLRIKRDQPLSLWPSVLAVFRAALHQGWRSREVSRRLQRFFRSFGWLSWPSALRLVDEHRLLVVEARVVTIVDLRTFRVLAESEPVFFNLTDAAVLNEDLVLLLEGGYEGEGRLLAWTPSTGRTKTLLEPLRSHGSVACDPESGEVRLTLSEPGLMLRLPISPLGALSGEPQVLYSALRSPRWIAARTREEWYCATAWGLVRKK
jgi:hypothetical protein